jgi:hypothetical protein
MAMIRAVRVSMMFRRTPALMSSIMPVVSRVMMHSLPAASLLMREVTPCRTAVGDPMADCGSRAKRKARQP